MNTLKSNQISPFGGLNFVIKEFEKLVLCNLLNTHLPLLSPQCKYQWKDILYAFWSIYFCGGDCIEDIGINLKDHLKSNPFFKIPSPDRVLDRFKDLSIPKDLFTSPRGVSLHEFSLNPCLNALNLKLLCKLNLDKQQAKTLDYDNTILFTNKSDSRSTYKRASGYCPSVGIIDNKIVFVENRNGNSGAKDLQFQTLTRMFRELDKQNINIHTFRADGASYQFDIIDLVSKKTKMFYIRAVMSGALAQSIATIKNWEEITLGNGIAYRAEINYTPFVNISQKRKHKLKLYRLIVTKVKRDDAQINAFTNDAYNYSAIITNDWEQTIHQVAYFYHQRGSIEKEFDVLKNDFGWNNLPFSKLEQNTVFLFTAMCRNLYQYIVELFSKTYKHIKPTFRINKFIFRFICIPAKWIKTSRQFKLRIYGNIHFET
jgi:hypothetical protein